MATFYWVGGSGTWDGSSTTNWSLTSGGAGGAGVPNSATDDVIFNSASSGASYVVTVGYFPGCKGIVTTAPATGTLTFQSTLGASGWEAFLPTKGHYLGSQMQRQLTSMRHVCLTIQTVQVPA